MLINSSPGKITLVIIFAAAVIFLAALGGYALRGEKTATAEKTVTVTASVTNVVSPAERDAYIKQIKETTTMADEINRDFRTMIDKYNVNEVKTEDLVSRADQNRRTYEDINRLLTGTKVPSQFQQPHEQLISGFNKWQQAFEAFRDGFRGNNNDLLSKARDLDSQAVIEVNQAINEISQGT